MVAIRRHKTSKRQSLRHKHKIEGKVREHNRRVRKEGKKMKALGLVKKKQKQVFKIPNLYPFKKELIEDLERKKKSKELEKKIAILRENDMTGVSEIDMERNAEAEEEKFTNALLAKNERAGDGFTRDAKQSMKASGRQYVRELKKVLEAADIILEVLDARDPMACRNRELEAEILGMPGDKKLVLVLNKIDLVPQNVANAWLNVLRREFATVLFKANTQGQGDNLGQVPLYKASLTKRNELVDELLQSSKAVGADSLLQLIKNYSKTDGVKGAVTVGLIGYPNVGKSSIINSLKRNKSVSVSSTPGHTKAMQEISLDAKVKLLDCPGVVLAGNMTEAECVLRNIIKVENVVDPIAPVEAILRVVNKVDLLTLYRIGDFNDLNEFLSNIALARGKFTKGGVGDLEKAAKIVLHDWAEGRIKFYTAPPEEEVQNNIMNNLLEKPIELE